MEKMMFWMFLLVGVASGSDCTFSADRPEENQNVTLEWNFAAAVSPGSLTIGCEHTPPAGGGGAVVLYSQRGGVEDGASRVGRFHGRVRCDAGALADGRLRLRVSELRPEDSGAVRCWVAAGDGSRDVGRCWLNVTAAAVEAPAPARPGTMNVSTGLMLMALAAAATAAVAAGYLLYMSAYER